MKRGTKREGYDGRKRKELGRASEIEKEREENEKEREKRNEKYTKRAREK